VKSGRFTWRCCYELLRKCRHRGGLDCGKTLMFWAFAFSAAPPVGSAKEIKHLEFCRERRVQLESNIDGAARLDAACAHRSLQQRGAGCGGRSAHAGQVTPADRPTRWPRFKAGGSPHLAAYGYRASRPGRSRSSDREAHQRPQNHDHGRALCASVRNAHRRGDEQTR
jgi:hypothetical protein